MPFHHVLLTVEPEIDFKCVFSDLSEKELESKFLKPYRRGLNIVYGNEVLSVSGNHGAGLFDADVATLITTPKGVKMIY